MRIFPDTNVLVSAFTTRGLCADLFRNIAAGHQLVLGEPVLDELGAVLRSKFKVPEQHIRAVETYLRTFDVVPAAEPLVGLSIRGIDRIIVSTAAVAADILVTGDAELLRLKRVQRLVIASPRELYERLQTRR